MAMALLPYSTVSTKFFTSAHISIIVFYRGCFFLLCYCSLEPLGPDFQNGADHWRQIRMSLKGRDSGGFFVPATQAKVTSEHTWFPRCRWLAAADMKIYTQVCMCSPCEMGLLSCNIGNVYFGPASFTALWLQRMSQISATELNPVGHMCHLWVSLSSVTAHLVDSACPHRMIALELSLQ